MLKYPQNTGTSKKCVFKSRNKYEREYRLFTSWWKGKHVHKISENVLISNFSKKCKVMHSVTFWSIYSTLKYLFDIDIRDL